MIDARKTTLAAALALAHSTPALGMADLPKQTLEHCFVVEGASEAICFLEQLNPTGTSTIFAESQLADALRDERILERAGITGVHGTTPEGFREKSQLMVGGFYYGVPTEGSSVNQSSVLAVVSWGRPAEEATEHHFGSQVTLEWSDVLLPTDPLLASSKCVQGVMGGIIAGAVTGAAAGVSIGSAFVGVGAGPGALSGAMLLGVSGGLTAAATFCHDPPTSVTVTPIGPPGPAGDTTPDPFEGGGEPEIGPLVVDEISGLVGRPRLGPGGIIDVPEWMAFYAHYPLVLKQREAMPFDPRVQYPDGIGEFEHDLPTHIGSPEENPGDIVDPPGF